MRLSLQRRWEIDAESYEVDMNDPDSIARYLGFESAADQKGHNDFVENEFYERLPNGRKKNKPEYGTNSEEAWKKYKEKHGLKF